MLCTYCGRSHTAASCTIRPRLLLALCAAALLTGCAEKPDVPPSRLSQPPSELMADPQPLPPTPACDGEVDCRASYYTSVRRQYADLASNHRGLQRWVRAGQKK
jgi:hypothetical protein